jgi:hypothetical protein
MVGIFFLSVMMVAMGNLLDSYVKEVNKNNLIINQDENKN